MTLQNLTKEVSIMVSSKINSRAKGATGERELAHILRTQGHTEARRGQQYCGANGDADVVGVKGIHIECKRQEKVYDERWMKQAEADAKQGEIPVVIYRRNHEKWKLLIRQDIADIIWQTLTEEQKEKVLNTL